MMVVLFTFTGVYGDVIRVKIMFNKKDNALIQFCDATQAQQGVFFRSCLIIRFTVCHCCSHDTLGQIKGVGKTDQSRTVQA